MENTFNEKEIKLLTSFYTEQEMEKAHKAYLREKERILANLEGLKVAIKILAAKKNRKVNKDGVIRIINNTIEFIKKGEM